MIGTGGGAEVESEDGFDDVDDDVGDDVMSTSEEVLSRRRPPTPRLTRRGRRDWPNSTRLGSLLLPLNCCCCCCCCCACCDW